MVSKEVYIKQAILLIQLNGACTEYSYDWNCFDCFLVKKTHLCKIPLCIEAAKKYLAENATAEEMLEV